MNGSVFFGMCRCGASLTASHLRECPSVRGSIKETKAERRERERWLRAMVKKAVANTTGKGVKP